MAVIGEASIIKRYPLIVEFVGWGSGKWLNELCSFPGLYDSHRH